MPKTGESAESRQIRARMKSQGQQFAISEMSPASESKDEMKARMYAAQRVQVGDAGSDPEYSSHVQSAQSIGLRPMTYPNFLEYKKKASAVKVSDALRSK